MSGKFVTQITTSKHFYDVTAHKFIQENCQDLKMKYINGLSADMEDLLTENGQKAAKEFLNMYAGAPKMIYMKPYQTVQWTQHIFRLVLLH